MIRIPVRLFTTKEAAKILCISHQSVLKKIRNRQLLAFKVARSWIIPEIAIAEYCLQMVANEIAAHEEAA